MTVVVESLVPHATPVGMQCLAEGPPHDALRLLVVVLGELPYEASPAAVATGGSLTSGWLPGLRRKELWEVQMEASPH
jgi:hypothetical protein